MTEKPTRVPLESETLIDHIATNQDRNIIQSGVINAYVSDHNMVYCIRKFNGSLKRDYKVIKKQIVKKFSPQDFLEDVASINWDHVATSSTDIDTIVFKWSSLFSSLI